MGCTSGFMKCGLNIINSLYAILGIGLIILGVHLIETAPKSYYIYVFVVAGIILVTSMLGCCGVCQEHICMTTTYGCILLALLILQIAGRFYTFNTDGIKKFAVDQVEKTWNEELIHPGAMNKTQQTFHCCGKYGAIDYNSIQRSIPLSCFPHSQYNATALYKVGCIQSSEEHFTAFFNYASAATWGVIAFTAVLVFCAFYLVARFRRKSDRYSY